MNTGDLERELAIRAFATADRAKLFEMYQQEVKSNNELFDSAQNVLKLCAEMQMETRFWRCIAIIQVVAALLFFIGH